MRKNSKAEKAMATKAMIYGFMPLFREGLSTKEIADHFGLATVTVYKYLDEIAELNHVPRSALLRRTVRAAEVEVGKSEQLGCDALLGDIDRMVLILDEAAMQVKTITSTQ